MENDIAKIDPNFSIKDSIEGEEVVLYSSLSAPFSVYGVFHDGTQFRRMPREAAQKVSEGVMSLAENTAGGRIRFRTDSPFVAVRLVSSSLRKMPHFAPTGSCGMDMYADGVYVKTFVPPLDKNCYTGIAMLGQRKMRDIMIELPLYSPVNTLDIGLAPDALIEEAKPYRNSLPAVFYGSSITQGGCASRPGTCYQGHISRYFDLDYINLGFSGCAKGEQAMADYISSLKMSLFFYDYDHNAPTAEHLRATHESFFMTVRRVHPDLPIIIMSRPMPTAYLSISELENLEIIRRTYQNALSRGDRNVYFLDGDALTALSGNEGTVDNCHPTDFGFFSMANALISLVEHEAIVK